MPAQKLTRASLARRKYLRRPYNRGIGVLYRGQYVVAEGIELGEGGLAFRSSEKYAEGDTIVLTFQIPNGSFVSTIPEVKTVGNEEDGKIKYGCFFKTIKFDHKREIRTFVSTRS